VVSFSPGQPTVLGAAGGVIQLSARRWALLRILAALLEPRGDVSHVVGSVNDWHLLRAVGRRPVLFTAALPGPGPSVSLWSRVSAFVAETSALARDLIGAGAPAERVTVIPPGVDLDAFSPAPPGARPRFRLLFASSPAFAREFASRGLTLLVEVARRRPDVDVVLLWRSWGAQDDLLRGLAGLEPPANVIVERRNGRSMGDVYRDADAVVCCYAAGFGKSAPNSIIEGLACGRPALVTTTCGLAPLIGGEAGVVAEATSEALAMAIDELRSGYARYATGARRLAEQRFALRSFLAAYRETYERLATAWDGGVERRRRSRRALPGAAITMRQGSLG
jgi:glycosyltransferase involved in cell wall biosynthesis